MFRFQMMLPVEYSVFLKLNNVPHAQVNSFCVLNHPIWELTILALRSLALDGQCQAGPEGENYRKKKLELVTFIGIYAVQI